MIHPTTLALALGGYLLALFGLAWWVHGRVHATEDFFVAGRRLSLPFATATLFGTWFGAGTLLASADEVRAVGLRAVAMEPLGAGLCLVLAGLFFARPLWEARLLTLADFYRDRFGRAAELLFSLSTLTFLGWIAAQLVGLAGLLEVFFDLPLWVGVSLTAAVALAYTLLGGMWSVTLTDAAQITVLVLGLGAMLASVLGEVGGLGSLFAQAGPERTLIVPTERLGDLFGWVNLLLVGALGNLAGTDLMQRVFSARSPGVAQGACLLSGVAYIVIGVAPALLGLAGAVLLPDDVTSGVLPALAQRFLNPATTVLFTLALVSAVLSTLDSAILAASSVVAHNMVRPWVPARISTLSLTRWICLLVTVVSAALALGGESAYALLEGSYALTLAGPFVPLVFGLFWRRGGQRAAVTSLVLGYTITAAEYVGFGADLVVPLPLVALGVSVVAYVLVAHTEPRRCLS